MTMQTRALTQNPLEVISGQSDPFFGCHFRKGRGIHNALSTYWAPLPKKVVGTKLGATMIYLASTSPFRRQQLESYGFKVTALDPQYDETRLQESGIEPAVMAHQLSLAKLKSALEKYPDLPLKTSPLLAGDQVLSCDHRVLTKSKDFAEALASLKFLSGKWHDLYTAVAWSGPQGTLSYVDHTRLKMKALDEDQLASYIRRDGSENTCGSYKFESLGALLMEEVQTQDPTAIMGLPMLKISGWLLESFGSFHDLA